MFCLSYLGALCDLSEVGLVDHVLLRMFARMLDVRGSMSGGYIARLRRGKAALAIIEVATTTAMNILDIVFPLFVFDGASLTNGTDHRWRFMEAALNAF